MSEPADEALGARMLRPRRSGDDCTHPHHREGPGTPEAGGSEERGHRGTQLGVQNMRGRGGDSSLEFKLDKRIGTIFLSSSGSSLGSCLTPCLLLVKFTKRQERTIR